MADENFFARVKAKLDEQSADKVAEENIASKNQVFLEQTIARLLPVAAEYKNRMNELGVSVVLEAYPTSITFKLEYANGGYFGCEVRGTRPDYRVELCSVFTDDGKSYRGSGGAACDESNWRDEYFEGRLKSTIDDAMTFASRYGGLRKLA